MAVAPRLRVALQLLCLLCCVVIATARVAVRKLEASPAVPTATGFSTSEILGSFLRCSAAFFSIAVVVQLLIDWDAGVVDPLAKPEKKEVAEPTSDAAEPLTLMEERGVTLAAPVYPKVPTKLQGAPLPKFTMADVAKHSTKDDCWVILDGRAYDVTKYIATHPGGVGPMVNMAGKDATDVFANYHAARVYKHLLPQFLVGEVTDVIVYPHVADFRAARLELLRRGLFETDMRYYMKHGCWLACLFTTALSLSLGYLGNGSGGMRLLGAAVMGVCWQQMAGLGHDLGHSGVTHSFHKDHIVGSLMSAAMGLSVGWWKSDHNTHHVVCNAVEHDPNIQHMPMLAITDKIFAQPFWDTYHKKVVGMDFAARTLVSYQHLFFYPLMAFGRINLYVQGFLYILTGADRHNYPKTELAGLAAFFCWVGAVAAAQPSALLGALWVFISHAVSGILHVQIVLSHWSMETYKGSPYTSKETEWYLMQLRTTMNVATHPLLDWVHIGLQFQIEHHLFPRLPRHNLRKARELTKKICEKHDIYYHEPGFFAGNLEMWRSLKAAALAARKTTKGDGGFYQSKLWAGLNLDG